MDESSHSKSAKSKSFQVSIQRTLPLSPEKIWNFLISREGLELWLGTSALDKWETGISFSSPEGIQGSVRIFKVFSHIRLIWKLKDWENESLLLLRLIPVTTGISISFHQEFLLDEQQREQMKQRWADVLAKLSTRLG